MMGQITELVRAPLGASLAIVFHLLDTLPSFPADLAYRSTPPLITGFTPEVYAQRPWLGLHSMDLTHTPPPDSHRKAVDVLKEEIFCSTGGNAATDPTSPAISPIAHSPTKHKHARSPSLCHLLSSSSSFSPSLPPSLPLSLSFLHHL